MNILKRIAAAVIFLSVMPLYAQTGKVDFNIRFLDRRIYYVETDPVYVQITITNNSPDTYRFKLADERAFSVDFDIRTMTNRPLSEADTLIRKRTQNQQVFFREIAMESGESFSFTEDLRDFINLKQPGSYRVRARVYPELFRHDRSAAAIIESNTLSLNLRPALIPGPDGIPLEMDIATGAVLVRQKLPPDEVVEYMLRARQESQWERFFLYLDIEAMLSREAVQKRRWQAENEEGRKNMVRDYRLRLQNSVDDGDISVIPTKFEIVETVYNNNEGTVIVVARFRGSDYTEIRRYTYSLERRDNIWAIVNYSVEGLGTEANERLTR
ncbi:MAG: hypothetical protein LBH44_03105 [Treponema sp.]|jgi:hypothetical protein|nr:hypothetical protein [Treponema sp.]